MLIEAFVKLNAIHFSPKFDLYYAALCGALDRNGGESNNFSYRQYYILIAVIEIKALNRKSKMAQNNWVLASPDFQGYVNFSALHLTVLEVSRHALNANS